MSLSLSLGVPVSTVLHPGDVVLAERGDRLSTLLGSCVSIILTDPRRSTGVMSHVVHGATAACLPARSSRDGACALERMVQLLQARAIEARRCQAYVYGGGNMFPDLYTQSSVGDNNVRWALQSLDAQGIEVLHCDVGGAA